jgi:hypothetical protein
MAARAGHLLPLHQHQPPSSLPVAKDFRKGEGSWACFQIRELRNFYMNLTNSYMNPLQSVFKTLIVTSPLPGEIVPFTFSYKTLILWKT